jgi:hypothetical protein
VMSRTFIPRTLFLGLAMWNLLFVPMAGALAASTYIPLERPPMVAPGNETAFVDKVVHVARLSYCRNDERLFHESKLPCSKCVFLDAFGLV